MKSYSVEREPGTLLRVCLSKVLMREIITYVVSIGPIGAISQPMCTLLTTRVMHVFTRVITSSDRSRHSAFSNRRRVSRMNTISQTPKTNCSMVIMLGRVEPQIKTPNKNTTRKRQVWWAFLHNNRTVVAFPLQYVNVVSIFYLHIYIWLYSQPFVMLLPRIWKFGINCVLELMIDQINSQTVGISWEAMQNISVAAQFPCNPTLSEIVFIDSHLTCDHR